uniref:Uncharacterized protein n=1 Tax=uncultured prokaryote TaxID=198431 RepID=A0A0H5Q5P0_9ZZZZ|nr:hypothetical protein [uncultured prokaryote]
MSVKSSSVGSSRYRQLRVTATHELNGRFSYSVYAKPLNKEWHEQQCMARGSVDGTLLGLQHTEDVIAALIVILEGYLLPGIDDGSHRPHATR